MVEALAQDRHDPPRPAGPGPVTYQSRPAGPGTSAAPLAVGLTVGQYCEHPVLRRTVDNCPVPLPGLARLRPGPDAEAPRAPGHGPYGSVSVGFENALHSLDKETGLLDEAVRALNAIDAVGICEGHGTSLRVFARALGWDVEIVEFELNHATGQRTLDDLSRAEMDALTSLNLIDAEVYAHAMRKMFSAMQSARR